jgi:hypothetical protein
MIRSDTWGEDALLLHNPEHIDHYPGISLTFAYIWSLHRGKFQEVCEDFTKVNELVRKRFVWLAIVRGCVRHAQKIAGAAHAAAAEAGANGDVDAVDRKRMGSGWDRTVQSAIERKPTKARRNRSNSRKSRGSAVIRGSTAPLPLSVVNSRRRRLTTRLSAAFSPQGGRESSTAFSAGGGSTQALQRTVTELQEETSRRLDNLTAALEKQAGRTDYLCRIMERALPGPDADADAASKAEAGAGASERVAVKGGGGGGAAERHSSSSTVVSDSVGSNNTGEGPAAEAFGESSSHRAGI